MLAETELSSGRLKEAEAHGSKALALSPDAWPGAILQTKIYLMQGRPQDAFREVDSVRYASARTYFNSIALYASGRKAESDDTLHQVITQHPEDSYSIATVYAFRNQRDEAFEWLDRAYVQRNSGLIQIKNDPLLTNLHSDPRFTAFLKKLTFAD